MPPSVIVAAVIMGLIVSTNLWANGFGGNTVVSALLFLGFLKGHRLAWQWGRIFPLIAGVGAGVAILVPAIASHHLDQKGWILLVIPVLFFSIVVALGRPAARAYFRLICPKCGKPTWRAADFLFNKAKCKPCDFVWE